PLRLRLRLRLRPHPPQSAHPLALLPSNARPPPPPRSSQKLRLPHPRGHPFPPRIPPQFNLPLSFAAPCSSKRSIISGSSTSPFAGSSRHPQSWNFPPNSPRINVPQGRCPSRPILPRMRTQITHLLSTHPRTGTPFRPALRRPHP